MSLAPLVVGLGNRRKDRRPVPRRIEEVARRSHMDSAVARIRRTQAFDTLAVDIQVVEGMRDMPDKLVRPDIRVAVDIRVAADKRVFRKGLPSFVVARIRPEA